MSLVKIFSNSNKLNRNYTKSLYAVNWVFRMKLKNYK